MSWSTLFNDFLMGKPDAIQAIFSILGFFATITGIIFVVMSFNKQEKINKLQTKINKYSLEKDRRSIRPRFALTSEMPDEYGFRLNNSRALNVLLKEFHGEENEHCILRVKRDYVEVGEIFHEVQTLVGGNPPDIVNPKGKQKQYNIEFEDEDGRLYAQDVYYEFGISITFPMLLD
ncbi:hypothetical protein [Mucilaginibacter sp. OK283]|uniref:hypothetical protein n=1 Tax=Mucilaginibacter sp. OK283 TaxID=1881049 RepID=UPI0008CFCCA1|nr:hypothetical protein [Mucilaginibacter sp. OK283]SEO67615.1 hypothetical protein SAMN05428947_103366 [Mucilaginibacter sp. OK283]